MKNYFSQKNMPIIILWLFVIKAGIVSMSLFDAIAMTSLTALFGFNLFLTHKERKHDESILEIVESNRKYLDDRINELDTIYSDAINKVDAKVTAHMIHKSQNQTSGSNLKQNPFNWG